MQGHRVELRIVRDAFVLCVAFVCCVAASFGIVSCTTLATRKDPTLAYVCAKGDSILYPPPGQNVALICGPTFPLIWDHTPIEVYSDTASREELLYAIDHWNNVLEATVFVVTNDLDRMDVIVMDRDDPQGTQVGATKHVYTKSRGLRAAVFLYATESADRILIHELGHVLGLGHDLSPDSIMYPAIDGMRDGADITEDDAKVLKKLYGPAGSPGSDALD